MPAFDIASKAASNGSETLPGALGFISLRQIALTFSALILSPLSIIAEVSIFWRSMPSSVVPAGRIQPLS
jgi:hypothetical protein